jgi:hypothetical protein
VKKLIGHRSINNTLIYTHLIKEDSGSNEFGSKVARTIDEARQLMEEGFEYVCDVDGAKLFRKRK